MKKYSLGVLLLLVTSLFLAGAIKYISNPDAISNYYFRVLIDGTDAGEFNEVSGLYIGQQAVGYQNSNDVLARKRPGTVTYGNITLKRDYTVTSLFSDWIDEARLVTDDKKLKDVTVILFKVLENDNSTQVKKWSFFECFPISWTLSPLKNGDGREVLSEEIVVAVNWFE
ncbi:MAG: phage tail protein [Sedimentisphaerales bacterium]|nr:phage tail protein [Sedimentisphaerales bacterium]